MLRSSICFYILNFTCLMRCLVVKSVLFDWTANTRILYKHSLYMSVCYKPNIYGIRQYMKKGKFITGGDKIILTACVRLAQCIN